jgi:hypothetical protein
VRHDHALRSFLCFWRILNVVPLIFMDKKMLTTPALALAAVLLVLSAPAFSQAPPATSDSKSIPSIDGGIGPCTADFTVTDSSGAPVYDAKIRVHIAYRFMSLHKLDLEIGTNADGKARFIGLPDHIKHGLYFRTSQGDRTAETLDDPANTCKAQFTVVFENSPEKKIQ